MKTANLILLLSAVFLEPSCVETNSKAAPDQQNTISLPEFIKALSHELAKDPYLGIKRSGEIQYSRDTIPLEEGEFSVVHEACIYYDVKYDTVETTLRVSFYTNPDEKVKSDLHSFIGLEKRLLDRMEFWELDNLACEIAFKDHLGDNTFFYLRKIKQLIIKGVISFLSPIKFVPGP